MEKKTTSMSNIKIIFFDIDGTLIDMDKKHISKKTLETLIRLKENNIMICLSTGRSPLALPQFDGIEADVYLTFNGSYCYDRKHTIFSNPIPNEDVKRIVENASSLNRPVLIATKDRMAANGKDGDLVEYTAFANLPVIVSDDFEKTANTEEIYQVMMGCRKEDYPAIMKNVHNARITAWWDRAVDIIPANGGKGAGVRRVLEYYRLDPSEALAFGDGGKDMEMFEAVGIGVAMGNASPQLKAIADSVCGSAADDGIYYYCAENGLI